MISYSRPKRSDLYTVSWSKLLENHTLHGGTYLYSPYMAVPPRGLENNDLENDDLENEDLENNDRDGAARRIKRLEGYRRREIRGR